MFEESRAVELLRVGSGESAAEFRPGQLQAIEHVVKGLGRLLVVQKTGWGKSFVYFIATRMLRDAGYGPALLISPLLSLMRNQIAAAERMGLRARTINSENEDEWDHVEVEISRDEVDILLISPERLANERFREQVLGHVADRVSLLVVDEAHCISDWGHDFRPQYRLLERMIRTLPKNMRLLATTATANDRVMIDLAAVLGPDLDILRGELGRPSLALRTMRLPSQAERLAWLADVVPSLPGSGIIYTLTVRDARQVAEWLQSRGVNVESYTGETGDRRQELENALLANEVKALVATTALGMGFDKPDLSFVIHYQAPGSVVAYYQQVGRAGRALDAAYGVLLSGEEETDITDFFIDSAFPTIRDVEAVLNALEREAAGLSVPALLGRVNLSKSRIEKTIALLALESPAPIAKQGSRWQLTAAALHASFWERAERLTALRRAEQRQMQEYVDLEDGHMEFLIRALDGPDDGFDPPCLAPLPITAGREAVEEAVRFLKRTSLPIEPRRQWPAGGMPKYGESGRIRPEHQTEEGRALCMWGDAGWGGLVRFGKYQEGRFADELVEALLQMVEEWDPNPRPAWITSVPSLRHPELVPDVAQRVAERMGLPYLPVLMKTDGRPEQKTMANSTQQARNLDGSLALIPGTELPPGPVLLIDDMVDSRWTLAVSAWLLRSAGCAEVFPVALAQAGRGS